MKKQKTLWLTVGVPGSGKSTYIKTKIKNSDSVWCSRDNIRFSLLGPKDDYFAKEKLVWRTWISAIQDCIDDPNSAEDIYVDATHLTQKARTKVLNELDVKNVNINCIYFNVPLNVCIERNAHRSGRAKVPESVIENMYKSLEKPSFYEEYEYNEIITINN